MNWRLTKLALILGMIVIGSTSHLSAQSGMKFDDINDYVSIPNASSLIAGSSSISLSLWVYPENAFASFPNFDGIAGIRNNLNADFYLLQLSPTNVEARFRNSAGVNFDIVFTALNLNQWNHFVLSYNGTTLELFHDGVSVGSIPANGSIANTTVPLEIGRTFFTNSTSSFYLNGKLDNVALWNTGLNQTDVTDLFTNTCSHDLTHPALKLCYEFTEGVINGNNTSITSLYDGTGTINGVFNGLALTGTTSNYALGVTPSVTTSTINATTCSTYTSPSGLYTYSAAGVYSDTLTNVYGCDSIITINLTNPIFQTTISESVCSTYTTPSGGATYTASGVYYDTLSSVGGCDSVLTINLTIATSQTSINETACVSYTTPSGGATYTTDGIYNDTLTSIGGCDSILIINLTFPTLSSTILVTECESYTTPSGGATYTTSGIYNDTLQSVAGCDSVVTINLTISASSSSITESACVSYTTPSGNATYTTSGTYFDTVTNSLGCDSVITINLTINNVDTGVSLAGETATASVSGVSYQWIDCVTNDPIAGATNQSFTPTVTGNYAVIVTSTNCSDTSECLIVNVVGLEEEALHTISAFPNPVTDYFTIDLGTKFDHVSVQLSTLSGQELMTKDVDAEQEIVVSMENFDSGIYLVRISAGASAKLLRVVKL